ncbi:MAG: hypothetical protein WC455_12195 [Dehalococcoidia bacterium]|jgi:hypothetical protein
MMSRKYIWKQLAAIILLASIAFFAGMPTQAEFLGIKKVGEYITFPVTTPVDSYGIPATPESIQVFTAGGSGSTILYYAEGADLTCDGIWTDTTFGGIHVWFTNQISEIDGAGGQTQLGIRVISWLDELPTETKGSVMIMPESLIYYYRTAQDSLNAAPTVAQVAQRAADSVKADPPTVVATYDGLPTELVDSLNLLLDADTSLVNFIRSAIAMAKAARDTASLAHASAASAATAAGSAETAANAATSAGLAVVESTEVIHAEVVNINAWAPATDTVRAKINLDALTGTLDSAEAPSLYVRLQALYNEVYNLDAWNPADDSVGGVKGLNAARLGYLDSIPLYDTRFDSILAVLAQTGFRASIAAIWDSIKLYDTRFDSVQAALATAGFRASITATIESLYVYDARWDSVLAVLASTGFRAQITETRDTIRLYDTRFDSILTALANAGFRTSIAELLADQDTLGWLIGVKPGSKSISRYHNDADTVFLYHSTDALGSMKYFHPADTAGAAPDSVKAD